MTPAALSGSTSAAEPAGQPYRAAWPWVLCLLGLDFFSTLGYQPSIAVEAAGPYAPIATLVVILAIFCGVLPVYLYLAGRSPHGSGSLAVLERLVHGWRGKVLILVLLGFAATDFVFTKTLSVADAAVHITQSPIAAWQRTLDELSRLDDLLVDALPFDWWRRTIEYWDRQMVVAVLLLALGLTFWHLLRHGFDRRVVRISVVVVGLYLLVNAALIGTGLHFLATHPVRWYEWVDQLFAGESHTVASWTGPGWAGVLLVAVLVFPRMVLGLSGWEMSLVILPLVKGNGPNGGELRSRISNTRKLLLAAALIVGVYLFGAVLVTTLLVPAAMLGEGGAAHNRALAYLAHGQAIAGNENGLAPWCGPAFGLLYDLSSVCVLCLAGASATVVLRNLLPPILHRFGMAFEWAHRHNAILYLLNLVNLFVTVGFHASVSAQRGAYATGVLVLITGAALAAFVARRAQLLRPTVLRFAFLFLTVGFLGVAFAVIAQRPNGLIIAGVFVLVLLATSLISRLVRSTELRFEGFAFKDGHSQFLWDSLRAMETPVLVPHRPGRRSLIHKEDEIRRRHRLGPEVPIVFLEVELGDASDFYQLPLMEIYQEDGRFAIRVTRAVSIAHVIAAVALELAKVGPPPEVHFGWSDDTILAVNLNFLLFGEGNVPWLTRSLINKADLPAERRPRVFIG